MNIGGIPKNYAVNNTGFTSSEQLSELNKKIRTLSKELNAHLCCIKEAIDNNSGGSGGGGSALYNNNRVTVNNNDDAMVFNNNTYHSISIAILKGSADITIDSVTFTATMGYTSTWEASTLLLNSITIEPALGSVVIVNTLN